jgi:replicative DNA helicase
MSDGLGYQYLACLIYAGGMDNYINHGLGEKFFLPSEKALFSFISEFAQAHGKIPAPSTVQSEGFTLYQPPENLSYYREQVLNRFIYKKTYQCLVDGKSALEQQDPKQALESLVHSVSKINTDVNPTKVVDFREASQTVVTNYVNKVKGITAGIPTAWASFDRLSPGMQPGDLISIVGRPASGKTFLILYLAMQCWLKYKKVPLVVSTEMAVPVILDRLTAMTTKIPLTRLTTGNLTSDNFSSMVGQLSTYKGFEVPFHVLDGNSFCDVESIYNQATLLKPDIVLVDGAYLLGHPNKKLNRFERVAENCRLLKVALSNHLGIPVVASWQFNRDASKKDTKGGLENIGFSDEIGQLSTAVLALMQQENVETYNRRQVECIKGRNGESGSWEIHWDFYGMNFGEYVEPAPSQLLFD